MTRGTRGGGNHGEQATCRGCGAPLGPGERTATLCRDVCVDGRDGFRDLLGRLTARIIGGGAPLHVVVEMPATPPPGYGTSTAWDTPRGEAANLPRMLREASARQTRFAADTGRRTSGGEVPSLAADDRADDRLTLLARVVAHLAAATARATGTRPPRPTWGAIARWIDAELDAVRRQDWAPAALDALREAVEDGTRHVDRPRSRVYLGPCDAHLEDARGVDLGPCPGEYYALEGEPTAHCTACRRGDDVGARKAALLEDARDLWLTGQQIERLAVVLLEGERLSKKTLDTWGVRGVVARRQMPATGPTGGRTGDDGPWHYLLGDVLGRLELARQRRRTA